MSKPATMTHAQRAKRRAAIKRALAQGAHAPEVAAQYGVSSCYVSQIAKAAGIPTRGPGAPRGQLRWRECPPQLRADYHHLIYRKHLCADDARWLLEQRA